MFGCLHYFFVPVANLSMSAIIKEAIAIADFDDPNIDKGDAIIGVLEDDSPYPEVRSAVANMDDILIPVSSWIIGAFSVPLPHSRWNKESSGQ